MSEELNKAMKVVKKQIATAFKTGDMVRIERIYNRLFSAGEGEHTLDMYEEAKKNLDARHIHDDIDFGIDDDDDWFWENVKK